MCMCMCSNYMCIYNIYVHVCMFFFVFSLSLSPVCIAHIIVFPQLVPTSHSCQVCSLKNVDWGEPKWSWQSGKKNIKVARRKLMSIGLREKLQETHGNHHISWENRWFPVDFPWFSLKPIHWWWSSNDVHCAMSQITWAEVLTKRPTGAQSWRNRSPEIAWRYGGCRCFWHIL